MKLKDLINVLHSFLKLFKLNLGKNKSVNHLIKTFEEKKKLNIYDKYGNLVGNFFEARDACYMNVMLKDLELSAKIYPDSREFSSYTFRYDIISFKDNKKLEGFYKTVKKENGKVFLKNDYKLFEGEELKIRCKLDNIDNVISVLDINTKKRITYTKDEFKLFLEKYRLFIHRYLPDIICYEKTNSNLEDTSNKAEGYILSDFNLFDSEVFNILSGDYRDYFSFISYLVKETDECYKDLYFNSVNKVFKYSDDKRNILLPQNVEGTKKIKRKKSNKVTEN